MFWFIAKFSLTYIIEIEKYVNRKGKDKEISEKQALLNAMNSKEFDISAIEKSVTNDNTNLQLEIKKANLRLNNVQSALQLYKNKIDNM